ncbi:MAG: MotA/TolQ/ExbB proton channel family protein [Arcobacteraceae bacterium]|jgi:chemotaxis protein MotA|nr:MotA/TolQ/ExbB proton channel family protein [Arcobacteraceae bacterium]
MDKTTAGGLAGLWGLVALAIILGGAGFGAYIDIPSVIIVFGGAIAVTMAQYEGSDLKQFGKACGVGMNMVKVESTPELIEKIIFYATEIKKNGVMSVEQKIMEEKNPFFKEAFALLVDNTKPDVIEALMETKLEHMENRHKTMIGMFGSIGGTAGAMGMIGTLVGLVAMLANLSDPSAVGPAMAVALLTTLYGALIGTGFAGVFEAKLGNKHSVEMIAHQITIQGAVMISSGESIGNIKMKLNAILPQV